MSARTSEELALDLARHLAPVRRIPRLRVGFARILAAAALACAAFLLVRGLASGFLDAPRLFLVFVATASGMSLIGVGASVASLALAVPGREAAGRAGLAAAALGVLLTAGVAPLLRLGGPEASMAAALPADLACLLWACALGILPAALALWFIAQAAPRWPLLVVLVACAGAVGFGGVAAQAACAYAGLRHLLLGHALAPLAGGLLLAVPFGVLLRLLRRSDTEG